MNVPTLVTALRLAGSPVLLVLALAGRETAFLVVFLALEASDWIDGKLAMLLDQRTTLGARLDTVADLVMYGALLSGLAVLLGDVFLSEWMWIVPALAAWTASWILSLIRFGTVPSYHARSAKVSWFLSLVAAVALLTTGTVLPLRVAATSVTVANLEAVLLTLVLDAPRSDVPSILSVRRRGGAGSDDEGRETSS